MKRGEIWYIKNIPGTGSVQTGDRIAVIVSNDVGNRVSPVLIVAPCTTKQKHPLPTHAQFTSQGIPNTVLCEQLVTIDKKQCVKRIGELESKTLLQVDRALLVAMGLSSNIKSNII